MRHARFGRKLNRDTSSRRALVVSLTNALFVNGKVNTTLAKAKFARSHVEKLITAAKKNRLSSNRLLASKLTNQAFKNLMRQSGGLFENKTSGFTRIIKTGFRLGDNAPMAQIELLGWDEKKITEATGGKQKTKRVKKRQRVSVTSGIRNQRKSALNQSKSKTNEKH